MKNLSGPPAVWAAFARQGAWKNWVLVAQFLVIALLVVVGAAAAGRSPDIIVVAEDGHGTYVDAATPSSAALQSWLREQRGKASDITIRAFTERFVKLTVGVNSTTVDEAWAEASTLMVAPLAKRLQDEATAQRLFETYRLASVRTTLDFQAIDVVERRSDKTHVRVRVARHKEKLVGGGGSDDVVQVDLVLLDVPRSRRHPDGLEVLDWRSGPVESAAATPTATPTQVTP